MLEFFILSKFPVANTLVVATLNFDKTQNLEKTSKKTQGSLLKFYVLSKFSVANMPVVAIVNFD